MVRILTRRPSLIALALGSALLTASHPAIAGDPGKGKGVFAAQCAMCHTNNKGGPTILGPNLYGVVGRKVGALPGYNYSSSIKGLGGEWSDDRLQAYLPAPRAMAPGTKMTYGGLKDPAKLADLIAFLDTLK